MTWYTSTHGQSFVNGKATPLYTAWRSMKQRCFNPKNPGYKNYGARGITVCERWLTFENFAEDMGARPGKGWTLERVNNDGNYEPSNCRWATYSEQLRNTRRTRLDASTVAQVKWLYSQGYSYSEIAPMFGCGMTAIGNVIRGEAWT